MDNLSRHQQTTALGAVNVEVQMLEIQIDASCNIPYEGNDPTVHAQFPLGFSPSFGSGLAFREITADGTLVLFCLTDRGPNGDGPELSSVDGPGTLGSKVFPAPGFTPSVGILHVAGGLARLMEVIPILMAPGMPASGLPIPHGLTGNSDEVPLFNALKFAPQSKAIFSVAGMDTEAIAYDKKRGKLWVSDEYGPFLMMIDPASGLIEKRYGPDTGLPPVLAMRRANRGMEGMTLDPSSGHIHAFLQSPLSGGNEDVERYARFTRWVEFDPEIAATVATYAYPLDPAAFADGRTGHAKLGDVAALGGGKFIVIEQGEGPHGAIFNHLMLVETSGATDIASCNADLEKSSLSVNLWNTITPLRKTRLLDLNAIGWQAEKAEGLTLVDDYTLALTNDNDFGMKTRLYDAQGAEREGADITGIKVDAQGAIFEGAEQSDRIRVAKVDAKERALTLWLLRFDRPLNSFKTDGPV